MARTLPDHSSRTLDAVETLPRAELERLQDQRLMKMLAYAGEHSALVRETWAKAGVSPDSIRSRADFVARAPSVDKDDLRRFRDAHDDPFGGLLCKPLAEVGLIGSSSGTTGDPTLFAWRWGGQDGQQFAGPGLDAAEPAAYWGTTPRDLWEMGLRPGDLCMFFTLRFRGPVYRALQSIGVTPVILGFTPTDHLRLVELSRSLRPACAFILSTPQVLMLLDIEKQTGIDMRDVFSSYKAVIFGGEPIGPRIRRVFERWGVADKLFTQTTLGDVAHAHDCRAHDGVHAWEDTALVELFDPHTGTPIASGEGRGELVVTSLINDVDPLIRFRSGDIVELTRQPCACGRTHARFKPLGRAGDEAVVEGRAILPVDVWAAIEDVEETQSGLFQIIRPQRELPRLRLRVGYEGQPDLPGLARRVEASVEAAIGLLPEVELVPNAELLKLGPPHKIPRMAKS